MKLHHIGYAVADMEQSILVFQSLGYQVGETTRDLDRRVKITFLRNSDVCLELVAPDGPGNPIENILKTSGSGPYHLCYETEDLNQCILDLKQMGWRLVQDPAPAPAIDNLPVAFLWNRYGGLIELLQKKRGNL